jgi:hypothetical protein
MQRDNRFVGGVSIVRPRHEARCELPSKPVQIADFGLNELGNWCNHSTVVIFYFF